MAAKGKKKAEKALNLDTILFNCRDYLRAARNSGSFFEKRDMMLTLVFLRFIGEKYPMPNAHQRLNSPARSVTAITKIMYPLIAFMPLIFESMSEKRSIPSG